MLLMLLQDDGTPAERLDAMIKAVAGGDRTALADLYSETRSGVYGFALSMLRNSHDAEDVLQEAYIRVWNSAASYVPKGTPMSWLLSIAKNLALMKLRARGRQAELEPEEWSAISVPDRRKAQRAGLAHGHAAAHSAVQISPRPQKAAQIYGRS